MYNDLNCCGSSNLENLVGHSVINHKTWKKKLTKFRRTFSTLHSMLSTSSFKDFSVKHFKKFSSRKVHSCLFFTLLTLLNLTHYRAAVCTSYPFLTFSLFFFYFIFFFIFLTKFPCQNFKIFFCVVPNNDIRTIYPKIFLK